MVIHRHRKTKPIFYIVLLMITVVAAALIPALYFYTDLLEREQERAAMQGVHGMYNMIEEQKGLAISYADLFSKHLALAGQVTEETGEKLLPVLKELGTAGKLDFVIVTDPQGRVLLRTHAPDKKGDSLQGMAVVKGALAGQLQSAIESNQEIQLAICAGAPLFNGQGQVVGTVIVGYDATKNEMVDRVKQLFNTEATLFLGDERVSTTIIKDGKRVISTKLNEGVAATVLQEGNFHLGRTEILGTDYVTAYLPLPGAAGKPVGVLFAGESLANFLAMRNKTMMFVGFILLSLLSVLIFMTTHRLHRQQEETRRILEEMVATRTEKLRESEARYRAVVEGQTDCIYHCNPQGELTFVNDAFCRFYGVEKEQVLGSKLEILFDRAAGEAASTVEASLVPENPVETLELRYVRPDGRVQWIEYVRQAFFDNKGRILEYQAVGRDITGQKEAEETLSKAREAIERASQVMTLAVIGGGIAHEIKQPLNAIKILVETVLYLQQQEGNRAQSKVLESIHHISQQADKIDAIVNHLRSLSRGKQNVEYVPCDLNIAVNKAVGIVAHQLAAKQISLKKVLAPELPPVYGSLIRFEEVVLNLLMNAIQAFDGVEDRPKQIQIWTWVGESVMLAVSDNGPGIEPEIASRIFDPFFTTKKRGDSIGLGLSIVELIVSASNGTVQAKANGEGGTTIQVVLPIQAG